MRRIAWALASLLVVAGLGWAAIAWGLPRAAIEARMAEQLSAWTGRSVSIGGRPEITVFPRLTVTIADVRVEGPPGMVDADLLTVERLTGSVRLLPLLVGDVEIGAFRMERPVLRLVRDQAGRRNWSLASSTAALQLTFAGDVALGEFQVEDGALIYEDRAAELRERLDGVAVNLRWPSVRRPAAVAGAARWRGEPIEFRGDAADPFAFLNGAATSLRARIDSPALKASFGGEARNPGGLLLSGAVELATPSLRDAATWLAGDDFAALPVGAASLAGAADYGERALTVDQARLSIDGTIAVGAVQLALGAVPSISGTIAAQALDLTPYLQAIASRSPEDGWRATAIDTSWLRKAAADLRVSSESTRIGPFLAGRSAATIAVKDGKLELGLAQATFYGGALSGSATVLDRGPTAPPAFQAQIWAADLDLAALLGGTALGPPFGGAVSVTADLAGAGSKLGELLSDLSGSANVRVAEGRLPAFGVDALAAAYRAGDRPAALSANGMVDFATLRGDLRFHDGLAIVQEASLVSERQGAALTGSLDLETGELRLSGALRLPEPDAASLRFRIGGTLAEPVIEPLDGG